MMTVSAMMGALLAAAAPQQQCVVIPSYATPASAEARDDGWFINNEPITIGKRTYVKYGLPRVLAPFEIEEDDANKGALVYVESGNSAHEVVYVLVSLAECSFQPYQVQL